MKSLPTSPPFSPAIFFQASGLALAPEADIQAPRVKSWESKGPNPTANKALL